MRSHPSRRRFFASAAAAVAVAPLSFAADIPVSSAAAGPLAPEPPLPPGVARQFGSARYRDLDFKSADLRFSADSKWLIGYDGKRAVGYEVGSGRRVQFAALAEEGWTVAHWLATTDDRLTVVEQNGERVRLRWYDLPDGRGHPPVEVHGGAVPAVSADGRTVVIEGAHGKHRGCWGVDPRTGATVWGCVEELQVHPFEPTGRLAGAGVLVGEKGEFALKLLDPATGRAVPLQSPGDGRCEVDVGWAADGGKRAVAHLLPYQHSKRWVCAWDTKTGKKAAAFEVEEDARILGPTADGKGVFAVDGKSAELVVRELDGGKVARRYAITDVALARSAVSPDGNTLLLGYPDNPVVRVIDADTGKPLPQSPDPPGPLVRVSFPSRTVVAAAFRTAADHHDYTLYDMGTGKGKRVVDPQEWVVPADARSPDPMACLHPDGRLIWIDGTKLSVYDPAAKKSTASVGGVQTGPFRFWLNAGTVAVVENRTFNLWTPATGKTREVLLLELVKEPWLPVVGSCRASADGRTVVVLATIGPEPKPALVIGWLDVTSGALTTTEVNRVSGESPPAVSADGGRVAVRMTNLQILGDVIEVIDGEGAVPEFIAYDRDGRKWLLPVSNATGPFDLSACGRTLVTQTTQPTPDGNPGAAALEWWEVAGGRKRASFPLTKPLADLRCSPCGRFVGTVRADLPLYLWDLYGETSDPKPLPPPREYADLWGELAAVDGPRGFAAVRTLVQHPAAAVAVVKANLKPAEKPKAEWIAARIFALSDRDYHTRTKAERELAAAGDVIADELKKAAEQGADTEEGDERLMRLVQKADRPADWLRQTRAVEALEHAGGDAHKLLKVLAGGASGAWLTREAKAALGRVG